MARPSIELLIRLKWEIYGEGNQSPFSLFKVNRMGKGGKSGQEYSRRSRMGKSTTQDGVVMLIYSWPKTNRVTFVGIGSHP